MASIIRSAALAILIALLWWAHTAIGQNQTTPQPPGNWRFAGEQARGVGSRLLKEYPFLLRDANRQALQQAMREFGQANGQQVNIVSLRRVFTQDEIRQQLEVIDRHWAEGARTFAGILAGLPEIIQLPAGPNAQISQHVSIPYHGSLLMLHRAGRPDQVPVFAWKTIDLQQHETSDVTLDEPDAFYCFLELVQPATGQHDTTVTLRGAAGVIARLQLSITAPQRHPVQVTVVDENSKPTEAAIGIFSPRGELLVPDSAVDFSRRGVAYENTRYRDTGNARFWPGKNGFTRCFFERGSFDIDLPEGTYRLIATKGPEYDAVDRTITVSAGEKNTVRVQLQRWTNMSQNGWHSGDCHIHFARPDSQSNEPLRIWTQAEDLRMSNILRMGDLLGTYYEQYAFGSAGRSLGPGGAIVPGQEDPRTKIMGHIIGLNLQQPVRDQGTYCIYKSIFDGIHRQGGLAGYAHAYSDLFMARRDMALNVPRVKVDFFEIAEFGSVKTDLYYDFLNLGFKLSATGGSDAPFGGTAGDARVYVYTGKAFEPDEWFQALQAGHTFATLGPILEFTVDGHIPGDEIDRQPGARLKVHARVMTGAGAAPIGALQVVANGDVVRESEASGSAAVLDFELPVKDGMWVAARTRDAHTTPVYVTVNGKHWKASDVPRLINARLRDLDQIEAMTRIEDDRVRLGSRSDREDLGALRKDGEQLRVAIGQARADYRKLADEAKGQEKH